MKPKRLILLGFLIGFLLFLYPFPSKHFLSLTSEKLLGRVTELKGASFGVFLDPTYYYKFKVTSVDLEAAISAMKLEKCALDDYSIKTFQRHGPLFWNFWWWQPRFDGKVVYYTGFYDENSLSLLFNPETHVAYLIIQNN